MMENVWTRFGIDHLSASHLKMVRNPADLFAWGLKYILRQDLFSSAAMFRGRAVETGWVSWLDSGDLKAAIATAHTKFAEELAAAGITDTSNEQRNLAPMIGQCLDWGDPFGKPVNTQIEIEYWFPDILVPVTGFIDVEFENGDVDLKTSTKLPNRGQATREHIRQVALYRAARAMRPHTLLYVTATKHLAVPVTDEQVAWGLAELNADALALQCLLAKMKDADDLMACLPGKRFPFPKATEDLSGMEDLT